MEQVSDEFPEESELVEQDPEPQPEPVFVNIRYAGQSYQVPEHLADVWAKREEEFQRKLSDQGRELGQLRQQAQSKPQAPEPESPDEDLEFFQSPSKAIQRRTQSLREELKQELREELTREQQRQHYWSQFYKDNADLKERERLVNFVVNEQFDSLKHLSPAESQQAIARSVREMLGQPTEERTPLPAKQVVSERPSNARPQPTRPSQEPQTPRLTGLSAELAARAERRRRAHYNVPPEEK